MRNTTLPGFTTWLRDRSKSICVSGPACSGVTTLAHKLSEATGLPVLGPDTSIAARSRIGAHILDSESGHVPGYINVTARRLK